jgi:hypothetical protein
VIAYLTHDDVNAAVARRAARELGLELTQFPVKDDDLTVLADVLLLDLDHLPPEFKSDLLRRAGNGSIRKGLAVHSYHLSPAEARALRAAGVLVARRLTTGLLDAGSAAAARQSDGGVTPHPL